MEDYYVSQVGSGLTPFEGMRYQRGHGLFSNFITGKVLPLLKRVLPYVGRTAIDAGMSFARNISEGNDLKTSAKKVLKKKAFDLAGDAFQMVKRKTGSGIKRRKMLKRKCVTKKKKKSIKAKPRKRRVVRKRRAKSKSTTLY